MTLRFSMVGDQATEHNQTGVVSDWQRGFALDRGKQVRSGTGAASRRPDHLRVLRRRPARLRRGGPAGW